MKPESSKTNLNMVLEQLGLLTSLEPYDYNAYLEINPKLTKKMYNYLRGNGTLWKVKCGKRVEIKYDTEVLEAVWWRDTPENYQNRYLL